MTNGEVAALVTMVSATWTSRPMSEATMRIYEKMLVDLDQEAAQTAIVRLAATSKFLPSIAEIREAAVGATHGRVRLGMEAWGDVLEAIQKVGFLTTLGPTPAQDRPPRPEFTDPIVAQCVRVMGGWMSFQDLSDEMSVRSKFCGLYDGLAKAAREDAVTGRALPAPQGGLQLGRGFGMSHRDPVAILASGIGRGVEKNRG